MSTTFTAVFWHEPLSELEAAGFDGIFEVGEVPDPDKLVEAGWWISADGLSMYPPETKPPEGAGKPYRPAGWPS